MSNFDFTSQICTTKEQSERLLVLGLKKETADMAWSDLSKEPICHPYNKIKGLASDLDDKVHPAWSLHRLMEMYGGNYNYLCFQNAYNELIYAISISIEDGTFNKEYLEE